MNNEANTSIETKRLFEPVSLGKITLKNRIIRSATYEGCGNANGIPQPELADIYLKLADGGVGAIITGFTFVSQTGRAMQPGQCGIDSDTKIDPWRKITELVHDAHPDVRLFMQIAHTGRQTKRKFTGTAAVSASSRKCTYFKEPVKVLTGHEIESIVNEFGNAARRAEEAGFDGIQVHAAHGYLIHQFLSPWTNNRKDKWADKALFLEEIINNIHRKCGDKFPVMVKLSWADDNNPGIKIEDTIQTVKRLETLMVDAVEISYGTMELALNIIRGACPVDVILRVNPLFKHIPFLARKIWKKTSLNKYLAQFIPFTENYNVEAALKIKKNTHIPIIPVGGIRTPESAADCIAKGLSAVSFCRPLICEPDFPKKLRLGKKSQCTNCNLCTAYCDSNTTLKCYRKGEQK